MKNFELVYFRILGAFEGTSLLVLLFIAMPVKYFFHEPALVKYMGGLHGVLFLMYVYTLLTLALEQKWTRRQFVFALLASSVPFGTFWFNRHYLPAL